MKKILNGSLLTFVILFSLAEVQPVFALGISPGIITAERVLKTSELKKTVNVQRQNAENDQVFNVTASGDGAPYLKFEKTYTLPKGKTTMPFEFYIAPKTAANGSYKAYLTFIPSTEPPKGALKNSTAGSAFQIGAETLISFTVSDEQIIEGKISHVQFSDFEQAEHEFAPLTFQFNNLGNIDIAPNKIVITVINSSGESVISNKTVALKNVEAVAPDTNSERNVPVEMSLPVGSYKTQIDFYINEKQIGQTEKAGLTVVAPGTLTQKLTLKTFELSSNEIKTIGIPVRIEAKVINAGDSTVDATLFVEILDGTDIVDAIHTEKIIITKSREAILKLTYTTKKGGKFKVRGFVDYGPNRTEERLLDLQVGSSGVVRIIWMALGAILLVVIASVVLKKRAKK